jgi:photosystem II stability/assembly factor-like uncharacterized protein
VAPFILVAGRNTLAPDTGEIWYTQDWGATWALGYSLDLGGIVSFVDITTDGTYWYATCTVAAGLPRIYRAASPAGPWTQVNPAVDSPAGDSLEITVLPDPATPGRVFTYGKPAPWAINYCWRSNDYAGSWVQGATAMNQPPDFVWQSHAGTLLANTAAGGSLQRSVDLGDNWAGVVVGGILDFKPPAQLSAGQPIYAANEANPPGLYVSNDDGATWGAVAVANWAGCNEVHYLLMTKNGTLVAVGEDAGPLYGIWRSTDGGLNWTRTYTGGGVATAEGRIRQIADGLGTIFAQSGTGKTIQLSQDDGVTWAALNVAGLPATFSIINNLAVTGQYNR